LRGQLENIERGKSMMVRQWLMNYFPQTSTIMQRNISRAIYILQNGSQPETHYVSVKQQFGIKHFSAKDKRTLHDV
jgi:hypothetical protein